MTITTGRVVGVEGGEKNVHWEGDYPPVGARVIARMAIGREFVSMVPDDHGHDGPCEAVGCADDFDAFIWGFAERDEFNQFVSREIQACRLTHPPKHVLALMEMAWLARAALAKVTQP